MYNRKKSFKTWVWEVIQISLCIIGALMFGMLLALPVLINLEMKLSIIDFLHRH